MNDKNGLAELEKRLWDAADEVHANSKLKASARKRQSSQRLSSGRQSQ